MASSPVVHPTTSAPIVELPAPRYHPSLMMEDYAWRVGTFQAGASMLGRAWECSHLIFEVEPDWRHIERTFPSRPPRALAWTDSPERTPYQILSTHPVDVLIVDHSCDWQVQQTIEAGLTWHHWLQRCPDPVLPMVVVQIWPAHTVATKAGPLASGPRKLLSQLGYE